MFMLSICNAQFKDSTRVMELLLRLASPPSFQPPDSSFIPMTNEVGYENAALMSRIKSGFFPLSLDSTEAGFIQSADGKTTIHLEAFDRVIQGKTGRVIIQEQVPPEDSGHEHFITVLTIFAIDKESSYAIMGAYPKSKDSMLREKIIRSAFTIQTDQ